MGLPQPMCSSCLLYRGIVTMMQKDKDAKFFGISQYYQQERAWGNHSFTYQAAEFWVRSGVFKGPTNPHGRQKLQLFNWPQIGYGKLFEGPSRNPQESTAETAALCQDQGNSKFSNQQWKTTSHSFLNFSCALVSSLYTVCYVIHDKYLSRNLQVSRIAFLGMANLCIVPVSKLIQNQCGKAYSP